MKRIDVDEVRAVRLLQQAIKQLKELQPAGDADPSFWVVLGRLEANLMELEALFESPKPKSDSQWVWQLLDRVVDAILRYLTSTSFWILRSFLRTMLFMEGERSARRLEHRQNHKSSAYLCRTQATGIGRSGQSVAELPVLS